MVQLYGVLPSTAGSLGLKHSVVGQLLRNGADAKSQEAERSLISLTLFASAISTVYVKSRATY